MFDVRQYTTPSGKNPFNAWLESLKDPVTQARIVARLDRLESGNLGDTKPVGSGVSELRIGFGSGYRIYYARFGLQLILLLCGGDKRKQSADIAKAIQYLQDYKRRSAFP